MKKLRLSQISMFYAWAISLVAMLGFTSCGGSKDEPEITPERTLIVYMADNNNLSTAATADIQEMQQGISMTTAGRLLVYQQTRDSNPQLMEIKRDGTTSVIRKYDPGEPAVSVERMQTVIADAKKAAPSQAYGLVLWSHATGWADDDGTIKPQSFGADGPYAAAYQRMSIRSLAQALEGTHFDYIYFDCCHMATVEVAYELRNLADYIVGSPTELNTDGMPYHLTVPYLLELNPDMREITSTTFDFYNNSYSNIYSTGCCMALIRTSALERLARVSRKALTLGTDISAYNPVCYFRTIVMLSGIYDMYDYFNTLIADNPGVSAEWNEAFSNAVISAYATPTVYGLDASRFHGLGCNILSDDNTASTGNYNLTSWFRDVYETAN